MLVVVDGRTLVPPQTGMGRFGLQVLSELAPLMPDDELVILLPEGADHGLLPDCANLRPHPVSVRPFSLSEQLALPRLVKELGADLYYSFTFDGMLAPPVPMVLMLFDTIHLLYPRLYPLRYQLYWRLIAVHTVRRASVVLTTSRATAADAERLLGVDPERLRVVPAGVGPPFRELEREAARAELRARFGLEGPFVLIHGNMRPHKNVATVLQAYKRLCGRPGQAPVLAISGTGGHTEGELRRLCGRLELTDSVAFLGAPTDSELVLLYNAARVFVFPSLHEGMGLPPLEAMACGTPVLTSRGSALEEWYGGSALLADPRDAGELAAQMGRLVADRALRKDLATRGRKRASELSWRRTALGVRRALLDAAGQQGRRSDHE